MSLNDNQKKAVTLINEPCLVIAGAGSGKTKVITEKIVYLLENSSLLSCDICAVTFTNKAAKEMRERIEKKIGIKRTKGLRIGTFHSLGLEILKKEYYNIGYEKNIILFDESDKKGLIREILSKYDLQNLDERIDEISAIISNYKGSLTTPSQVKELYENIILSDLYDEYQRSLKTYNAVDFDDLIFQTTLLLTTNKKVRESWSKTIKYILVDEYQDTNKSQYDFLKLIIQNRPFTFVGDDDQSIYSWRGARADNINDLQRDFPSLKVITLNQNYRSVGRILKCANCLISNNKHEYKKELYSSHEYGEKIKIFEIDKNESESKKIIVEILAHHYLKRTKFSDYAILYRSNHQSRELEKCLRDNNIPYRIFGNESFFSKIEVKDILAYVKVIANYKDDHSFLRIINIPSRGIGVKSIEHLQQYSQKTKQSLLESCLDQKLGSFITKKSELDKFVSFGEKINELRIKINAFDLKDQIKGIISIPKVFDYEDWIHKTSKSDKAAETRIQNVNKIIEYFAKKLEEEDFENIVNKLIMREMLDTNDDNFDLDEVQLMTLHSSKGLEFNYVYIIGVEEGILPHQSSIDSNNIEEERRLMYVGITRAKKELTLSYCTQRNKEQKGEYSRFLDEIPKEEVIWNSNKEKNDHKSMDDLFNVLENMLNK